MKKLVKDSSEYCSEIFIGNGRERWIGLEREARIQELFKAKWPGWYAWNYAYIGERGVLVLLTSKRGLVGFLRGEYHIHGSLKLKIHECVSHMNNVGMKGLVKLAIEGIAQVLQLDSISIEIESYCFSHEGSSARMLEKMLPSEEGITWELKGDRGKAGLTLHLRKEGKWGYKPFLNAFCFKPQ